MRIPKHSKYIRILLSHISQETDTPWILRPLMRHLRYKWKENKELKFSINRLKRSNKILAEMVETLSLNK